MLSSFYFVENGFRGGSRVRRSCDGPSNHDVIGAGPYGLRGGGNAELVVLLAALEHTLRFGANPWIYNDEVLAEGLANPRRIKSRSYHAIQTGLFSQFGEFQDRLPRRPRYPYAAKGRPVHAGQGRNSDELRNGGGRRRPVAS